jgi:hypothetical protein
MEWNGQRSMRSNVSASVRFAPGAAAFRRAVSGGAKRASHAADWPPSAWFGHIASSSVSLP